MGRATWGVMQGAQFGAVSAPTPITTVPGAYPHNTFFDDLVPFLKEVGR
jgi:hypothetical protein